MGKKVSQVLKTVLSVLLAGLLLYFAFRGTDWGAFLKGLRDTRWGYILLSMLAALAALVFRAERWRAQLATIDPEIKRIRIWDGSNIGNFLNLLIPGIGEFYRCAHVCGKKTGYDKVFGSIIMERSWDVLAIMCLLAGAVASNTDVLLPFMENHVIGPLTGHLDFSLWIPAAILVLAAAALVTVLAAMRKRSAFCEKCWDKAAGVLKGFAAFAQMRHKWLFLLYTAGIWVMYILMTWFTFLAVPELEHMSFSDAVFISAVGNIASVIPTPGNLGAYHYLVGLAISTIYLGADTILEAPLLFATLSHGSHAVLLIIIAIISYIAIHLRNTKNK